MIHLNEYGDFDNLLGDMQNLGLALTNEEIKMCKFIEAFGRDMDPDEFVESLHDYYRHPEEYDIDVDSEYYETIEEYYEELYKYKRFRDSSPINIGNYARWQLEEIEFSEIYKLYQKMNEYLSGK